MRDFIVDSVVRRPGRSTTTTPQRRNLIAAFDTLEESQGEPGTSRSMPRPSAFDIPSTFLPSCRRPSSPFSGYEETGQQRTGNTIVIQDQPPLVLEPQPPALVMPEDDPPLVVPDEVLPNQADQTNTKKRKKKKETLKKKQSKTLYCFNFYRLGINIFGT